MVHYHICRNMFVCRVNGIWDGSSLSMMMFPLNPRVLSLMAKSPMVFLSACIFPDHAVWIFLVVFFFFCHYLSSCLSVYLPVLLSVCLCSLVSGCDSADIDAMVKWRLHSLGTMHTVHKSSTPVSLHHLKPIQTLSWTKNVCFLLAVLVTMWFLNQKTSLILLK